MRDPKIANVRVVDLRFPTSNQQIGSDAVNRDPDYSAAYCILETDAGVEGHGLTFTLGRGNELCVSALKYLSRFVEGRYLSSLTADLAAFSRQLTRDTNSGTWPEKGVIHLAAAALINAVSGLICASKVSRSKLLADMEPEQIVRVIDFTTLRMRSPERRPSIFRKSGPLARTRHSTYSRMATSLYHPAGWIGFSDDKIRRLCSEALPKAGPISR